MNSKSTLSTVQAVVLVGAALYVIFPDLFIGPIDDTVVALVAGIAEMVLGYAKKRVPEPSPDGWEDY